MRVVLEPVPSGPRDRPRWTHLGRRVSYGEPWVWRLGGGKGAGGCSDGDYTASRCVPGVSSCPSCETRRVGTGCGRARSHFCFSSRLYIPGLEDDRSIRTGGIRVRMGSHSPGAATLRHHNFFLLLVFGRGFPPLSRFFKWVLDCTALTHNERAGMQIYGRRRRVVCAGALSTFLM